MAAYLMTSCGLGKLYPDHSFAPGSPNGGTNSPGENSLQDGGDNDAHSSDPEFRRINHLLDNMTLEEKVGQMLFLAYRTNTEGEKVHEMDDALKGILGRFQPGGFVLFSENLESIHQTVSLINSIQAEARIPLLISIDEEGGLVTRLNKVPHIHSTEMPDAYTIGSTKRTDYAYSSARAIAEELSSLGFNMDFAPVADIFSNPENKVIGKRAYGNEPELVSEMVKEAVKGFKDGQIIPVLKHFPGHGDTVADTHTGAASVDHDLDRLMSFELVPFRESIAAGADVVMIAHILLPNLTEEPVPASLSKEIVTDLLRNRLGFNGVVITDALEMSAVSAYFEDEEAAIKAVQAGVDMLLMPQSAEVAYNAIIAAVKNGLITEERVDESVSRILHLKEKYGVLDNSIHRPDPELTLGNPRHRALAEEIKSHAE